MQRIKFQKKEWLLICGDTITTQEAYSNFKSSYAHLYPDGNILRYGKKIGTKDDIQFLDSKP